MLDVGYLYVSFISYAYFHPLNRNTTPEAESKEKHGVWDSMPELTITSSYVDSMSRLLQHVYHGQLYAIVDLNPVPESTLSSSQGLWIWPLIIKAEKDTKYVSRLRFIVTAIQFINSVVHTYTQWT